MPEPETRAAAAADRLLQTSEEILTEVQHLPSELIHWVPAPGVWTVMDNLCHIREFVTFWTGQTLRIVRTPGEAWGRDHTDTARLAAVTDTAACRLDDVVADIREAVRRSAETLKSLSDADLAVEATSRNPRFGRKPASFVVEDLLAGHVAKHLGQIRRNVSQFNDAREGVKIRVIGGGPAGLFFAYLMARQGSGHDVRLYERDPEGATYGWGLVFSDVALSFVREIAPEVYDSITRGQVVFDDMEIVHQGQHVTLAGNTFHRLARIDLLRALHHHCRQAGVGLEFEHRCDDVEEFADADLIVAADGARSAIRTRCHERFEPTLDERPNLLAWYGTTRLFAPLSLIFRQSQDGLVIAHCYQYSPGHSTFLVEVPPATFRKAGLDRRSEAESLAWCEAAFADDLEGRPLLSNRTTWFRYTIVSNREWSFDNVVLLGDALRTGHPSIGLGTRLAMQDAIALAEACQATGSDVPRMLEQFRRIRRPGSDALQQAAIKSTEWYENLGPKLHLDPISFAYDYLRRSGRVSHADVQKRDPALAAAFERLHPAVERS